MTLYSEELMLNKQCPLYFIVYPQPDSLRAIIYALNAFATEIYTAAPGKSATTTKVTQ